MQHSSDVVVVVFEQENQTTLTYTFLHAVAYLYIYNLYLLSPEYLGETPQELKFEVPTDATDLVSRLLLIRKAADVVYAGIKPGKKQLDLRVYKPTILVHNLGLFKALKQKYEQERQQKVDSFNAEMKIWEQEAAEVMKAYWEDPSVIEAVKPFPQLEMPDSMELMFFDTQVSAQCCISGYLQVFDDALVVDYIKNQNFNDLMAKLGISVYQLPRPIEFCEDQLFYYVYNPYEEVCSIPWRQFIRIPDKPEEDGAKKKKKADKKHKDDGYFGADGSLILMKVLKFIAENSSKKDKNDDLVIYTVPTFYIRNCGKFIDYFKAAYELPSVVSVTPKDEKQFMAQCKVRFDDVALGQAKLSDLVYTIDKIGYSGEFYRGFLQRNRVVQWGVHATDLKMLRYFDGDKTVLSDRVVEMGKAAAKPQKGMENIARLCKVHGLIEDRTQYLRRIYQANEFSDSILKYIGPYTQQQSLSHYNALLDRLPYELQNYVSSVMEAMIAQLEFQPVAEDQPSTRYAKRAPSAKKSEYAMRQAKQDKNAPPPAQIPFTEYNAFGVQQKDMNIYNIAFDYSDAPKYIDDKLIKAMYGYLYSGDTYFEIGTKVADEGLEIVMFPDKQQEYTEIFISDFMEKAYYHDYRLIDYYSQRIVNFKRALADKLQQQHRIEWEARKAEYLRQKSEEQETTQYNEYHSDSMIEDANVTAQRSEYDGEYQEIEISVDELFNFSRSQFYNSASYYLSVQHRSCIFALIGDFLQIDTSCDEKSNLFRVAMNNWQNAEQMRQNYYHLLKIFENSTPRLFYAVPCFNVFINNAVVQQMLLNGGSVPKAVKLTQRFVLPCLARSQECCSEIAQPLFPCANDALDVTAFSGNLCLFNYFKTNVQETIDSLFGTVAFVHDYDVPAAPQALEDLQSARSSSAKSAKGKPRTVKAHQNEPAAPTEHCDVAEQDTTLYYYTKYTQQYQSGFNQVQMDTKLYTKMALPFNYLQDMEVDVPPLAPLFDLRPADFTSMLLTNSDALGLHFMVNNPADGRVEHTILNVGCQAMRVVFYQTESQECEVGKVSDATFNTPGFNTAIIYEWLMQNYPESLYYPDPPATEGLTVKQLKQLKDLETQQLAELKKRKKRAQELAALCKNVSEARTAAVESYMGKAVVGKRPTKAAVSCFIANSGTRISLASDGLVCCTEDMLVKMDTQKVVLSLVKEFYDIHLDQLGIYDDFEHGDFINTLLCLKNYVDCVNLAYVCLRYTITLTGIEILADVTPKSQEKREVVLLKQRFEDLSSISDQLEHDSIIQPKTGSKYNEYRDSMSVETAVQRIINKYITKRELFQLSWAVLLPHLEEDSHTVNYYYRYKGIASIAACSARLQKQKYTELLDLGTYQFTEQEHYMNVLEGLKTKKDQILKQNPGRLAAKVAYISNDYKAASFLIQLPFGAAVMVNEHAQIKMLLSCTDYVDHFLVEENRAEFVYSDSFAVGQVGTGLYISDIKGTLGKSAAELGETLLYGSVANCYYYDIIKLYVSSQDIHLSLGAPNRPFMTQPRDPHDFVAPRELLLRPDERPAGCLLRFAETARNQRVQDFLQALPYGFGYAPRMITRSARAYFQVYECDGVPVSNLVLCDEIKSTVVGLVSHAPEMLQTHFGESFESMQKALTRMVPKYQRPLFVRMELRQPQIERNFQDDTAPQAQVDTSRTDGSHCSDLPEQQTRLPKASEVLATVRRDERPQIKLDFTNKFSAARCYWATPEGRLFDKDSEHNEDYYIQIEYFENLAKSSLDANYATYQVMQSPPNVSGNLFKKALYHHRRNAIPTALKPIEQPRAPERPRPTLVKPKRELDIGTIIDYALSENYALAGVNVSYLDREKDALRRTKNASAAFSGADARQLLLEPNSINILITPVEMEQLREENKDRASFSLFHQLKATNVGRESLHLRWHRGAVENSNVHSVEIITKKGGIPPGLSVFVTVEFRIDFTLQQGETLDAIVFRTEEEIVAVPVVIFYGQHEEVVQIEQSPPRAYSQQGELMRARMDVTADDFVKTDVEVIECAEQSAGEAIDEDYEPIDLGEMEQMKGYGGDDIVVGAQPDALERERAASSGSYSFEEIYE